MPAAKTTRAAPPASPKTPQKAPQKTPQTAPEKAPRQAARPAPGAAATTAARRARSAALPDDPLARFDFLSGSLGYTLRLTQVRMYGLFFEMLGDLGLTPARVTALSLIATSTDMNQAQLARALDIAGPSVLKLVDALEAAGLVCRLDVQGDRRRYALALTATGRSKLEQLRVRMAEYEERIARGLAPAEREQLIALLNRTAVGD